MNYQMSKTAVKGGETTATVTIAGIIASVIAFKLCPWLSANGAEVSPVILTPVLTGVMQGGYVALRNFLKHNIGKKS